MICGAVIWNAEPWILPVIGIAVAFLALIVWSYRRTVATATTKNLAGGFKLLAVSLLLLCLLEPLISGVRPRPGANQFVILVDNSRSMRVDRQGLPQTKDIVGWTEAADRGWRARLEQDFDVRLYRFGRDLQTVGDPQDLQFDNDASNLARAMDTLSERYRNRPLAGMMVITDGNATDVTAQGLKDRLPDCPIYPIWTAGSAPPMDIRVTQAGVSQTHFETSPTTIYGSVSANGYAGETVTVELVNEADEVVEEQQIEIDSNEKTMPFRFRFRPAAAGLSFFGVRAYATTDRTAFAKRESAREATLENNTRILAVRRGGGPFRILYVAGRPNWEFKFLRRALSDDDELQLVSLLRIAKKEAKFQFRDQGGVGDSNRLFEGFDDAEEADAETYDEPVFVRIDVTGERELANGFPSNAESLFLYDAVVLDDLEASFFSPDQMLLLRRYVNQRGGGLLMLGGVSSFGHGGYARTPIGEMLPVYLQRSDARQPGERVRLSLTREGLLETWTRLRSTEDEELQRLREMPGFYTLSAVSDPKPGAMVVAECKSGDQTLPAIVTQRFGKGRTMAVMIGDLWRWSLERPDPQLEDPAIFWRQLLRALVADVPQRVEIDVQQEEAGQATELLVHVKTREFLPDDNASVELAIQSPKGEAVSITAEPSPSSVGTFTAAYWPDRPGGYRVTSKATGSEGDLLSKTNEGWVFAPDESEFEELGIREDLLNQLASNSGGRAVKPDELGQFVTALQRQPVPVTEHWVAPLWHQAWVFSLAIVCLCAEWGLRRWRGLA